MMVQKPRKSKKTFGELKLEGQALVTAIKKDIADGLRIVCEAMPMANTTMH